MEVAIDLEPVQKILHLHLAEFTCQFSVSLVALIMHTITLCSIIAHICRECSITRKGMAVCIGSLKTCVQGAGNASVDCDLHYIDEYYNNMCTWGDEKMPSRRKKVPIFKKCTA